MSLVAYFVVTRLGLGYHATEGEPFGALNPLIGEDLLEVVIELPYPPGVWISYCLRIY